MEETHYIHNLHTGILISIIINTSINKITYFCIINWVISKQYN